MAFDSELYKQCARLVPLGPWIDRCKAAGIAYIAASFSQPFPVAQMTAALDGEDTPELDAAFEWSFYEKQRLEAAGERPMMRWECCCDGMKKWYASRGEGWRPDWARIEVDDDRALDCTVGETTRLCVRPWVKPQREAGYPVEFRVFVGPEGPLGVSSYYPQRPLPNTVRMEFLARRCLTLARKLAEAGSYPVGFTADFLVADGLQWTLGDPKERRNVELLRTAPVRFLEGGPPHVADAVSVAGCSADPCCFRPGEIHGIALADRNERRA
jgi:hypothetical protein